MDCRRWRSRTVPQHSDTKGTGNSWAVEAMVVERATAFPGQVVMYRFRFIRRVHVQCAVCSAD